MKTAAIMGVLLVAGAAGLGASHTPEVGTEDWVDRLLGETENLRPEVLEMALDAYSEAAAAGLAPRPRLTIIDYELPSFAKRLWVVDVEAGELLFEEWVAHGMGSPSGSGGDMTRALSFSNDLGTRKSSVGLFRTAETYQGKHGYSLRLDGLESGINDRARERTIVMHSADYVSADRAAQRLVGRSWGCPAVRPAISRKLIDAVKGGSLMWVYYPDERWIERSAYLGRQWLGMVKGGIRPAPDSARKRPTK